MSVKTDTARNLNNGGYSALGCEAGFTRIYGYLEFIQPAHTLFTQLTIRMGGQIFNLMRILLFITLMLSMAAAPATALASCASMGSDMDIAQMSSDEAPMEMAGMGADDCANMNNAQSQSHDADCMAACALVCPGFYSVPDLSVDQEPAFRFAQYAIPQIDPGLATASHLDPPPPRI